MMFNFHVNQNLFHALASGDVRRPTSCGDEGDQATPGDGAMGPVPAQS